MSDLLKHMVNESGRLTESFVRGNSKVNEDEGPIDVENAPVEEPVVAQEYLGRKGNDISYYLSMDGGDIKVLDQEDKVVLSAKDAGIEIVDVNKAVAEVLSKLDIEDISYAVYMKYLYPSIVKEEVPEEEPKEDKPEEPKAEEPKEDDAEEEAPVEGKVPKMPVKDTAQIVKELSESGKYAILASSISDKAVAEEVAKMHKAYVVEDKEDKAKFMVIKEEVATQPVVPKQEGEDPTKTAKMGDTGEVAKQPVVPKQEGEDPTKTAKDGATGEVAKQPVVPKQEGEDPVKAADATASTKDAEKEKSDKLTLERKKRIEELRRRHGLRR